MGTSILFVAAHKSSFPSLSVHPRATASGVELRFLSPQGQYQRQMLCMREGRL